MDIRARSPYADNVALLGQRNVIVDETTCRIDELLLQEVVRPATLPEVGDVVRRASAAGQAIYPLGGRTQLHQGGVPRRPGLGVDLTALTQVIDYPARDMTITVQAGLRISELQGLLCKEGQRLPIDVPAPARATLGGILATNASGSRRLGAGTLRDYVIGITTINDEGQETKAGGRVVKNVAGYDLCKLHVGALGTLGIIAQVTLKVRPVPEAQALLTFGCDSLALEGVLDQLHGSRTRPTCVDVVNAPAARTLQSQTEIDLPQGKWVVIVGFEDSETAVNWQIQQLLRELTGMQGVAALAGAATEPLWQTLAEATAWAEAAVSLKVSVLPAQVARVAQLAGEGWVQAHAGSGIVRVHLVGEPSLAQTKALIAGLTEAGGHVVVVRCPVAWKRELPLWGAPRGDVGLMRRVKEALDPRGIFNPGRFVDGI